MAALLRLGALDSAPLAPDEAARALTALQLWRAPGMDPAAVTDGPAFLHLLTVWFILFTPSDGAARAPSALASIALCATPLMFRSWLGAWGALVAGALMAVSPVLVLVGRSADPAALALLCATVAVGAVVQACERCEGRWLLLAGGALAVGLGTTPAFTGQLLAVAVAGALVPPLRRDAWPALRPWVGRAIAVGLGAAAVLDTLLLTRPSGLQAGLIDPLAAWPSSIGWNSTTPLSLALLGVHEALVLVLAAWGAPAALRQPAGRFLLAWAGASLVLALFSRGPSLVALGAPLVPLALVSGSGAKRLAWLRRLRSGRVWTTALALLVPLVFWLFATNGSVNRGALSPLSVWLVAGGGVLAVALLASSWLRRGELGAAAGLVVAVGILALSITALSRLDYAGWGRGATVLFTVAARPELRAVESQVRTWWRQDPSAPVRVDAALRPFLQWSLRDGPPIEWITAAPPSAERAIVSAAMPARPAGDWLRLVVAERYLPPAEPPSAVAFWRWLVARQSLARVEPYAILISH